MQFNVADEPGVKQMDVYGNKNRNLKLKINMENLSLCQRKRLQAMLENLLQAVNNTSEN